MHDNQDTNTEFYYSDHDYFNNFRQIHAFYESLGFAINQRVVEFDNVFNLFIYPAYWDNKVKSLWASFDPFFEIEKCLRNNWFGEGKQLKDFSNNFLRLGRNYHYERIKLRHRELNCKNINITKSSEENQECDNLTKMKEEINKNNKDTSKSSWNKLYY